MNPRDMPSSNRDSDRGGTPSLSSLGRRDALSLVGSGTLFALAGCLGGTENTADDAPEGTQFDAEVKWTRELFGAVRRPLTVNLGFVFVVTERQRLYCLGTDGSGYWHAPLETAEPVAPVVGDRERWSVSLGTYVGHGLACTHERVFCPVTRDDGQWSLSVVADASIAVSSASGTTATAGGEPA